MIYLHKILPVFVMPIMLIIYLLVFALWKKKRWPIYTAIICLYVFSTPIFASCFFKLIEGSEPRKTPKDMPNADAIVVLSGMINQVKSTDGLYPEWGDPDRFFGGIELFKAGKAPMIIFTGGKMPWDTSKYTEGDFLKTCAKEWLVPDSAILVTNKVENTEDEVEAIHALLGNKKQIIIVTSAFHMKRATQLFKQKRINFYSYEVDYKSKSLLTNTWLDFFPDTKSLKYVNTAYREMLGRFFFLLKRT